MRPPQQDVAVVGIACRFPGADGYEQFWENLVQGVNSIREMTPDRWDIRDFYSPNIEEPNKTNSKWCGLVDNIFDFDHQFFQISPREAINMDPQQRLLLEETHHCIEDSGIPLRVLQQKKTSVYVGVMTADYLQGLSDPTLTTDSYAALGNYESLMANRVSYTFDLQGASLPVNAACASSIIAIHEAKRALIQGDCDFAFASCVNLNIHPLKYISFSKSRMLSPDGQCKTFDKDANGYVPGDGIGVLLLQRLDKAIEDGNHIYGVIKGSAVNHTGKGQSVTAPRMKAQRDVILGAYETAGFGPDTVGYIEAHGTGTSLGDPIEVEALTQAFRAYTDDNQFCQIGSVKTNIGHLESAAGMAGVIKVLMMMKHRKVPKSLNVQTLNPIIDFESTPFSVSTALQDWRPRQAGLPLRAGVSSFGFGGVNSHVLIEEYQEARVLPESAPARDSYFFLLSAKNKHSLENVVAQWRAFVNKPDFDASRLWDISNTLLTGRESYPYRFGKLIRNQAELKEFLRSDTPATAKTVRQGRRLHVPETPWNSFAEIKSLYVENSVFRDQLDALIRLLEELRVPQNVVQGFFQEQWVGSHRNLYSFLAGYAYAATLIELGVAPKLLVGEQSGLRVALAISGVLDVKDLLAVLSGNMELSDAVLQRPTIPFYDPVTGQIWTPVQVDGEYVQLLLKALDQIPSSHNAKVIERYVHKARLLYDSQFTFKKFLNDWHDVLQKHSSYDLRALLFTDELLSSSGADRYKQEIKLLLVVLVSSLRKLNQKWALRDPQLLDNPGFYELIDLLEGQVMTKEMFVDLLCSDYPDTEQAAKVLHERIQATELSQGYAVLREHNQRLQDWIQVEDWFEVAARTEAREPVGEAAKYLQVDLKADGDANRSLNETLLALWLEGAEIRWDLLVQHQSFRKISLPVYPFKRDTFRFAANKPDPQTITIQQPAVPAAHVIKKLTRPNALLTKQWAPSPAAGIKTGHGTVAILTTYATQSLADAVSQLLPGEVRILNLEDLRAELQQPPHVWEQYAGCIDLLGCASEESSDRVWISWLQKWIEFGRREELLLLCVTKGLEAFKNQQVQLSGSSRAGLYRMLQSEYRHIRSRHMDGESSSADRALAEQIVAEFRAESEETEVCYRDGQRYRAYLEELPEVAGATTASIRFSPDEVLLITGGTRGLGFLCAQHFVKHYGVKRLVLTGRDVFPPREQWNSYQGQSGALAEKLQAIQELERHGVDVRVWSLPLTDASAVRTNIEEIKRTLGPIGGVIHCAGSLDRENPAFIRKSVAGIEQTLGPKLIGADHLYQSVKQEPLRFFVLFSSVSAVIPTLAAGVSDYGMANAHLDYFAHAVAQTCPVVAIQWPSWKEAGMGEFKNTAYEQTGLMSITNQEGLTMLDRILAEKPGRVVLPAVYNPDVWHPEKLMQRTLREAKKSGIQTKQPPAPEVPSMNQKELITATQTWLISLFSKEMNIDASEFELDIQFQDYGMDSILLAQVVTRMDRELKTVAMDPSVLLENPTMTSLADYLAQTYPEVLGELFSIGASHASTSASTQQAPEPVQQQQVHQQQVQSSAPEASRQKMQIAVVGLACQFPDAPNARVYWDNLLARKDSMREVPKSRWDINEHYHPNEHRDEKSISKWGGFLPDIEQFDPEYFHIPESLAVQVDPLQRKFLEVGAEAIADAGYGKKDLWNQQVGVFVGSRVSNFHQKLGKNKKETIIATGQNFIAAHISHVFNFKGPNMVIDSACSSSLTAVHLAAKSILHGECDLALAGGVEILLDETMYLTLSAASVLSPDGRCKTFSANANGIGLGEGCGVLLLKPLQKAIEDGNKIYGIIDGSAINNDGNTMGITTPNPEAQKELIEKAIADAKIKAESINYVETHGTGTLIGDPIELKALTQVFGKYTTKRQFCGVGSVKSNIGHLLSAAGMASLIKVLLGLTERKLPSTLHCSEPNPRFQFQDSPFYIVQDQQPWTSEDGVLRAGVSAFGLGGNNAHVLVSNEGVPASLQARLENTQRNNLFNRKRYWPWPEQTEAQAPSAAPVNVNRESEFMSFFDSFEDDGRNE
ncbi:type I polyketide synthase [Tumebacillus permanentifrigoris]|uniref:Ketoacyl-synthetase-like protein n=1 Tax=Tumebacillus permanentifrigoris TaxID=378543 RepID=A0A316DBL7_9BACL|nr:type I polyketide synthase [Tumebacillus permanentifrigoris]PWK14995.1 ketoacyl-synthetase-like protein [Tumebacillus permanentifrigoris]